MKRGKRVLAPHINFDGMKRYADVETIPRRTLLEYFIAKFNAIPESQWLTRGFTDGHDRCCALGWCGKRVTFNTKEAHALRYLVPEIYRINDHGKWSKIFPGGAKARVVGYLKSMRRKIR